MSEQFNPCEFCGARECVDNKCKLKNIAKKIKQENEKLRKENQEMYKIGCENFVAIDQAKRLYKLNKCIDEIEKICTHETINLTDSCVNGGRYFEILQKIKEVKGDE